MKTRQSKNEEGGWQSQSAGEFGFHRSKPSERWHCRAGASQPLVFLGCLLLIGFCSSVLGQGYAINWHTIDGGGGTSTGGVYSVSGTIGQPDASQQPMTGGNYALTGGFWALYAVQTPGAPTLTIVPAGAGQAQISWTPATTNWVLQENLNLTTTNWVNSPSGSTNPIVVPANLPTKFYRLSTP